MEDRPRWEYRLVWRYGPLLSIIISTALIDDLPRWQPRVRRGQASAPDAESFDGTWLTWQALLDTSSEDKPGTFVKR